MNPSNIPEKTLSRHWLRPWALSLAMACVGTLSGMAMLYSSPAQAVDYSVSMQDADLQEFISTVSASLDKTIILEPGIEGKVTVRSYEPLTEEQYYQFFLNVLQVHGLAAIEQDNNVIKVVKSSKARTSAVKVINSANAAQGDEVVTWVMPLKNIPARELSPLLRQLNGGNGNVVHYGPANILLLTGRAANIERLVDIASRIDKSGGKSVAVIPLEYGSAVDMVRILKALEQENASQDGAALITTIVADEYGNRLILSGTVSRVEQLKKLIVRLDKEQKSTGNTRVFYLKYAVAEELKAVLEGVGETVTRERATGKTKAQGATASFSIDVHKQTNALVVTAQPDIMRVLDNVIQQLDIRRAQVLVEAVVVEVSEGDGIKLSSQLAGKNGTAMQFQNGNTVPIGQLMHGLKAAQSKKGSVIIEKNGRRVQNPDTPGDFSVLARALAGVRGAAFTITSGDWTAFLQAVTSSSESNVLATPSLMTLDNEKATFVVGDEVPTLTGSTPSAGNNNPYQTIERRQVGIKLSIRPQVNEGDSVKLLIEQEVSKINGTTPVDITFAKREVKTSVMVASGGTVIIGGLIDENVQESVSKVPLLGDIPYLGVLFRSTSSTVAKRNLMVFIRPTIIRSDDLLSEISGKKYSLMRARQLDRRTKGVNLLPKAQTPVLPEQPGSRDILKAARSVLTDARAESTDDK